ncbi:unnamed protein product [Prorocentrum cordatum]|uniref:Uncharacterized protein n=1 Tax=Prorocentrum cordatum TaxID=2364126 RepID=A0ABN9XY37_9DINO|nr:unnamed protein product [Polarella glacialis]
MVASRLFAAMMVALVASAAAGEPAGAEGGIYTISAMYRRLRATTQSTAAVERSLTDKRLHREEGMEPILLGASRLGESVGEEDLYDVTLKGDTEVPCGKGNSPCIIDCQCCSNRCALTKTCAPVPNFTLRGEPGPRLGVGAPPTTVTQTSITTTTTEGGGGGILGFR